MKNEQIYGYCRVSTKDQNEHRQIVAMQDFGIPEKNILVEKVSGKDFDRPVYQSLLRKLKPGDTLVVKSLDRLGRDYAAILDNWRHITRKKGAYIVVIDIPLLDTRKKEKDLTNSFIAELVLQILSYVSEQERVHTLQRQAEGIAVAKSRGVRFGRPPKETPQDFVVQLEKYRRKEISLQEALKQTGLKQTTFYKLMRQHQQK